MSTGPGTEGAAPEDVTSPGAPRHWAALDGLRGLAVVAVVAYHLGEVHGGFLGVDLFFVLSGFLITTLLLRERDRTGRISLRHFWERRARRLLPALAVTLVGVLVAARIWFDPRRLPALRWDALAAAFYVANWRFARLPLGGYFAPDPSPLRHTWSLGIEEQYYLVWPLLVVGVLALARRRGVGARATIAVLAAVGAVLSTAWMMVHADSWSIDRLYLGTDTRVVAPLLGALTGCVLYRWTATGSRPPGDRPRALLGAVGLVALGALAASVFLVSPDDRFLYRGGFTALALLGCVTVAAGVLADAPTTRWLEAAPLRWLGERSYGIYLYSWPIQMVARDRGLHGGTLVTVTVVLTALVSVASYRWIEMPVRRGTWPPLRPPRLVTVGGATALTVALVFGLTVTSAKPNPLATKTNEQLQAEALGPPVTVPRSTSTVSSGASGAGSSTTVVAAPARVLIVGDSVGYTLGKYAPDQIPGVASVDSRSLVGCGLITSGPRPEAAVKVGAPATYDGCRIPIADADTLGLRGEPDVVLLVTGPWERNDHERYGRTVGPGDPQWTRELRGVLDQRIDTLTAGGAKVALYAEPCARTLDQRRRQRWWEQDVLRPTAEARDDVVVLDPSPVVCRRGRAITDVPGVGDPRPDDGEHWSPAGADWLWTTWMGTELQGIASGAVTD